MTHHLFLDYNVLDKLYLFFNSGWGIQITDNIPSDGLTVCSKQMIYMKFWDIHLLVHELMHVFNDCGVM